MHLVVQTILSFFDKVINEVVSVDNELIVIGGDWNVALNPKIDSHPMCIVLELVEVGGEKMIL